jgi:hypothetical protein
MCNPSAMGSRQASLMIWARCRGGNLLWAAHAGFVQQESLQAALLVAAADSPDSGRIALQAVGYGCDGFTSGHGQDDAGMLNLEPGQTPGSGNGLQDRQVSSNDGQGARVPATHGRISDAEAGLNVQHTAPANFLHDFMPGPLGPRRFPRKTLPQDVKQIDEELFRPLFLDQLGSGSDPGCIFDQPGERANTGVNWVDENALDGLWR